MSNLSATAFPSANTLAQNHNASAVAGVTPWRAILAVEPDIAVLNAKSLLLTRANYCVTPATGLGDLFSLRNTNTFALAILSDRLGQPLLGTVAGTVRRQWPKIRILILGQVPIQLEDYLYDEHISRSSDPQQVLADLEWLYEGMWNERSKDIDCNASRSAQYSIRRPILESDPTTAVSQGPTEYRTPRDVPTDIRIPATRASRTGEPPVGRPTPSETTILAPFNERPS